MTLRNKVGLALGPLLFVIILFLPFGGGNPAIPRIAAIATLMAVWWITEAIPIPATSLLPVALFPVMGIMPGKDVAPYYYNSYIFLFMGGFIIALAMERWNLHKRIALHILNTFGSNTKGLILGFMSATALLSMWISNTASAMVMLPIGISIILLAKEQQKKQKGIISGNSERFEQNFPLLVMLGIAYGSSIGGVGTIIGTPPNVVFLRIFEMEFPQAPEITFAKWLVFGLPFVLLFLAIGWATLVYVLFPIGAVKSIASGEIVSNELKALGPMTKAEKRQFIIFTITALLWIFRKGIQLGSHFKIPGWAQLLHIPGVDDGTVAIFMSLVLFLTPSGMKKGQMLMDWKTAGRLPWGILLLFGGGFALAGGFTKGGLSEWIGQHLLFVAHLPVLPIILIVSSVLTFLTELTSNTATSQMALPVLAAISRTTHIHPLMLMLPATIAASCAFMLPVATPPNAIVFGSGYVPIIKMVKAGFVFDIIGLFIILILMYAIAVPIFSITPHAFPAGWTIAP